MLGQFFLGVFVIMLLGASIKQWSDHWWAGRRAGSLVCVATGVVSVLGLLWLVGVL